ncbi:2-iminobutanoate/2-iminopropanoate deaminase [Beauveria bassiana]|uniref:2-iminobutanoate/2-iminopropanoate deaminase n=1 Tax=Beauveria bassiana TaxID=176275 RepID=A0A2N6NFX0_BEABA|nr:2-iminobutanoate/2-iminopropanoate deaminase [Beauveria bassiana]
MSDQTIIYTKDAPAPVGPYSQAIKTPFAIYCSGAIPLRADGSFVGTNITDQTTQCCANLKAVLTEAGSSISKVVKTMIFISDMAHFAVRPLLQSRRITLVLTTPQEMNTEYEKHFSHKPARSCVAVKTLPKDVDVEIECIALP